MRSPFWDIKHTKELKPGGLEVLCLSTSTHLGLIDNTLLSEKTQVQGPIYKSVNNITTWLDCLLGPPSAAGLLWYRVSGQGSES